MAGLDLNALLEQARKLQDDLGKAQERLGQKTVTGTAGGGMVVVTANGRGEVQRVQIDPKAVDPSDVAMLEDLIVAAVNAAHRAAQEAAAAEMPVPGGLPGMGPGFPGMGSGF